MLDPTTIAAWLGVVTLSGGMVAAVATAATKWVVRPLSGLVDRLERMEGQLDYHLEPNGSESAEERARRRSVREIALEAERVGEDVQEAMRYEHEKRHEHEMLHARLGLEDADRSG